MPLISLCYFKRLYNLYENNSCNKTRTKKTTMVSYIDKTKTPPDEMEKKYKNEHAEMSLII